MGGGLTFDTAAEFYKLLEPHFEAHAIRKLDLSYVVAADSAGLALLLELQAMNRRAGQDLQIENAPSGLLRLARLCDAIGLLNIAGRGRGS